MLLSVLGYFRTFDPTRHKMSETNVALARGFLFFGGSLHLDDRGGNLGVHKCRDKPTPSGMGFDERTEIFPNRNI